MNKCSMSSMSKVLHGGYGSLLAVVALMFFAPVLSHAASLDVFNCDAYLPSLEVTGKSTTCPITAEPCWVDLTVQGKSYKFVCQFPWYDFNECEDLSVNDCVDVKGHCGEHNGELVLFVEGLSSC